MEEAIMPAGMNNETAFVKLGSIKGKAVTKGFEDWIVFQSMSFGIQQSGEWEEGNRLSGRVTAFSDLTLVKEMDESSPYLAAACATKEQLPKAEIALVTARDVYLKVTLDDVIITSVSVAFRSGETKPTETVTLKFRKFVEEWGKGAGYDLRQNAKV
jgi:type VI secretion system secreted protein Hcp